MNDPEVEHKRKGIRAVKSKGSKIEQLLINTLTEQGFLFETNVGDLTGKPDIVFRLQRVAIFCDGEFWHGKDWETKKHDHKSNELFWHKKIETNMERDTFVNATLEAKSWKVLRFWGEEIQKDRAACVEKIKTALKENNHYFIDTENFSMVAETEQPKLTPQSKPPKKKKKR